MPFYRLIPFFVVCQLLLPLCSSIAAPPNWIEFDFTKETNVSTEAESIKSFTIPFEYATGASVIRVTISGESPEGTSANLLNSNGNGLAVASSDSNSFDNGEKLKMVFSIEDPEGQSIEGYGVKLFQIGYTHAAESTGKTIQINGSHSAALITTTGPEIAQSIVTPFVSSITEKGLCLTSGGSNESLQIRALGLTVVPLQIEDAYEPSNKFMYDDLSFPAAGLLADNAGNQMVITSTSTANQWGGYSAGNNFIRTLGGQIAFAGLANSPGSYIYSILSGETNSIDLSGHEATFKIQAISVSNDQKLRWLVRDGSGNWYLSDETWEPTLSTTIDERHMVAFPVTRNNWQSVTNGNLLNELSSSSTPLELGDIAQPNLSQVSGYGIYVSQSNASNSLFVSAFRLSEYEPLIYYHPGRASHWFEGPNNLRVGLSDMSGAAFNEMYWNTDTNVIAAQNGRQCQYAFRSFYHSGRWNPTQAGYDEFYGMPTSVQTSISSLGDGPRYEWGPTPLSNWHGDGRFDFAENEDLTLGSPYSHLSGWRDRPFLDDDFLDESDRTQADEVISDFNQGGYVEDVSSATDEEVLAIRLNLYQEFPRLSHNTFQFNDNAIIHDTSRRPESEEPLIDSNRTSADISSVLPGAQPTTVTDMTEIPYRWSDRLDVLAADFQYLWNWDSESQQWTVTDLVADEGTIPTSNDSFFSVIANSGNPDDAATAQAIALYYPAWSEFNQFPIVGIDRFTGEEVYRENRLNQVVASAIQTVRGGWIGPNDEISGEFTRRQLGFNYGGILSPNHTPTGVFERLRQEFFWIFGTPSALAASIPDIEDQFGNQPVARPGRAQLRTMPGEDAFVDEATNVPTNQGLSWWTATGADKYHVYLGMDPIGIATADINSDTYLGESGFTAFFPEKLDSMTTYYWRVDSENSAGLTVGDVWKFTTSQATFFDLATIVTLNLGAGATGDAGGVPSHSVHLDKVLISSGAHTVELKITGSNGGVPANIRKVPSGIAANGLVVVEGNANNLGVGQSLNFDLQVKRAGESAFSGDFQILDFTYKGRTDNNQRDYSITDSAGEVLVQEINFDPVNYDPTTPTMTFTPGDGLDFSLNRIDAGGAIFSIETLTLLISNLFDEEPVFTAQGTPHSFLDLYYSGLEVDEDYALVDITDTDGDGLLGWQEYLSGTNPSSGSSALKIIRTDFTITDKLRLRWKSALAKSYSIYLNDSLDENSWLLIESNIDATPPENEHTISLGDKPRFIRIAVE